MAVRQLFTVGDSLTAGKVDGHDYAQGGSGCWVEQVRDSLAQIPTIGPLISSGIRLTQTALTGYSLSEWSPTGTWAATVATDPWDKYFNTHGGYASGSGNKLTYTVPAWMPPIVGVQFYWIDLDNAAHTIQSGNWSWQKNGGGLTNMGQALQRDNSLNVFYETVTLGAGDTITVQAANAAGTAGYCLLMGIELFFAVPTSTQGLVVHNCAIGAAKLHVLAANLSGTGGDEMAFYNAVKPGTGSPLVPNPDFFTCMFLNDVQLGDATQYGLDLDTWHTRAIGTAPVIFLNPFEVTFGGLFPQADQTSHRAKVVSRAAGYSPVVKVLDLYDAWASNGWTGNAPGVAAGLFASDNIHESQAGHDDIARRALPYIKREFFPNDVASPSYPSGAKVAAPTAYNAKVAAPTAFAAALPAHI